MTWTLSFPETEPLRPGTIVHWTDFTVNNVTSQDWIEVGLSGIHTTALNTNTNEPYSFVAGANFAQGLPAAFVALGGSTPVASTLLDLHLLNGGTVSVHNRNLAQPWTPDTALRTSLVFIEPGARIF